MIDRESDATIMDGYEDFSILTKKERIERLINLLTKAGIRIRQRVIRERDIEEHVIEVHKDDLPAAQKVFWDDVGPGGRTFTSR